ncbi:hypothetical protein [Sphingobium chungangianum]|jgi:hypothetical protein
MQPEVRQDHLGPCPICGLALEPEMVTAKTGPNAELIDMTRRFWIAWAITIPVFLLEMGSHLFPAIHRVDPSALTGHRGQDGKFWLAAQAGAGAGIKRGWPELQGPLRSMTIPCGRC